MDNLKMHTPNLADENFRKLAALFPNAVTETITGYTTDENGKEQPIIERAIDADVLRQETSATVVEGPQERYQFTWPDKKKSVVLANAPIAKTLRLDRSKSVGRNGERGSIDTENIYIEGDNLDALKLLQETYLGKVKMIYIDPPYNTGSDFIYEDDFSQEKGEYLAGSGQLDEEGNRLVQNTESNGRFHTDWLNMLYPRLRIAKDLLNEDGMIFVSIDYNETANLKKIMDEIFGAENFQREIIWRIGWLSGYKTTAPNFIRNHDTILFYSKNKNSMDFHKHYITNKDFKPLVKNSKQVKEKLQEFGLSAKQQSELLHFINHENRPERYPLEDTWNCNEYDDLNSIAIVSFSGEKISKLLDTDQEFKGQKALSLLIRLLESATADDDIILDFFSGTATTAHAAMHLNAADGGNRKFIMVQLPEATGEADFETICDIGEERIRRAGDKIREETGAGVDYGFRVFRVDTTNMENVYYNPMDYEQTTLKSMADNIKPDRTPEDLLFQVMLDLGVLLSSSIEEMEIAGKRVFSVADGYLLACFDKDVTEETVTEIAKRHPFYAVFRDSSMASDSVAANFDQIFQTYSPRTDRRVL